MANLATRIASRVFLAFTCRRHIVTKGFGYDGADKGVAAFDYRYQLLFWAYPKDGKVKVVYAKKADDAFYYLRYAGQVGGLGDVGKSIREHFIDRPRAASSRNFKVMVWNTVMDSEFTKFKGASFIVDRTVMMDYDKAKAFLTTQYEFSLKNFYAVFGGSGEESSSTRFSCEGMDFEVNDSVMTEAQVAPKMAEVRSKLPESLAAMLMYGNVELKRKFKGGTVADYTYADDYIRIDDSDDFVTSMIHEMGHRWHYKFSTPAQMRALTKLYKKCKNGFDTDIEYNVGDTIELVSDPGSMYVIVGESDDGRLYLYYKVDGRSDDADTRYIAKWRFRGSNVSRINGAPAANYSLPRRYAGKNLWEFIACCFEHTYCGLSISEQVKKEFVNIVEGQQGGQNGENRQ